MNLTDPRISNADLWGYGQRFGPVEMANLLQVIRGITDDGYLDMLISTAQDSKIVNANERDRRHPERVPHDRIDALESGVGGNICQCQECRALRDAGGKK